MSGPEKVQVSSDFARLNCQSSASMPAADLQVRVTDADTGAELAEQDRAENAQKRLATKGYISSLEVTLGLTKLSSSVKAIRVECIGSHQRLTSEDVSDFKVVQILRKDTYFEAP